MRRKSANQSGAAGGDPRFQPVIKAFGKDPQVHCGEGKGFGSGALKVNGKIFATMSSKGSFVVKLPKARVDDLVSNGKGQRFDPGYGRLMREWLVVNGSEVDWIELAREARDFVARD